MRLQCSLSILILMPVLSGCGSNASIPQSASAAAEPTATRVTYVAPPETLLLVSLEDGSVIKQIIDSDADICFKQNSDSATTCLSEGDPIIDAATNEIIGFEMIENHINLVARPN